MPTSLARATAWMVDEGQGIRSLQDDHVPQIGIKHMSILYNLPYWGVSAPCSSLSSFPNYCFIITTIMENGSSGCTFFFRLFMVLICKGPGLQYVC